MAGFMKKSLVLLGTALFLGLTAATQAATLYQATSETGSRYNPNGTDLSIKAFDDVLVATPNGENSIHLDSVAFGIRRGPTSGFLLPVDVEFFAAVMTGDTGYELGTVYSLGTASLDGRAAGGFVTELVTRTPNLEIPLNLGAETGYGALWLGLKFSGDNAQNAGNGWRIVNPPSIGLSDDLFGRYGDSTPFGLVWFGGNPTANFYLTVEGTISQVPEPAAGALFLLGAACLAAGRRGRNARA